MSTPISSVRTPDTQQDSPAHNAQKADHVHHQPQAPATAKSGEVSGDQVTLKSAGNVNSDNS